QRTRRHAPQQRAPEAHGEGGEHLLEDRHVVGLEVSFAGAAVYPEEAPRHALRAEGGAQLVLELERTQNVAVECAPVHRPPGLRAEEDAPPRRPAARPRAADPTRDLDLHKTRPQRTWQATSTNGPRGQEGPGVDPDEARAVELPPPREEGSRLDHELARRQ